MTGEEAAHHEEVTSPDQLRPTINRKLLWLGAIVTIIALVAMALVGNHQGNVEKIWLIGIAGVIFLWIVLDVVLRKLGLRPE